MACLIGRIAACLLVAVSTCAAADNFEGFVTHVSDGDTLWVRPSFGGKRRSVRLLGIDAPEVCQAHGALSRQALADRALHRHVKIASNRRDGYQRTLASVSQDGEDLGAWMVSRGHAWSYRFRRDRGPYAAQEARARSARLGLWRGQSPLRPYEFRKQHGSCK